MDIRQANRLTNAREIRLSMERWSRLVREAFDVAKAAKPRTPNRVGSMAAARKYLLPVALLCACRRSLAQAANPLTDLEARVGANYEPVDADERDIWQSLERLKQRFAPRHSE